MAEDVGLHLGVPATGLMTEVHACIEQGFKIDLCHVSPFVDPLPGFFPALATYWATSKRKSTTHV